MPESDQDLPLFSGPPRVRGKPEVESLRLLSSSSLNAGINAWGEDLEAVGRSIHTVKAFTSDLRLLAEYIGGGKSLMDIGTHDLKNFLEWMLYHRGVPCSPKTFSRRITSMKAFFRWLTEKGVLDENPADPIAQQTVLSPLPQVLTREEATRILEAADSLRRGKQPDARPYALVGLLLETGIKKGECLSIHLNHIHQEAAEGPILFVRYGDVRKRYKERKIPLSPSWIVAFQEYLSQYEPQDRLFPWSPRRLEYLLEDLSKAVSLDKHLSFDMCRWTCALIDYSDGMEKDRIRQKLGLSKVQWREVGNKLDRLAAKAERAT